MSTDQLRILMEQGEEMGCINMSAFTALVHELELDDEELNGLYEQIEGHGIELTDDCSLPEVQESVVREQRGRRHDDRLAAALPQRGGPLSPVDGSGGGRAREGDRARRQAREGPDGQLEPPPRRVDREEVPGPRPAAARPDPGRDHRPDPRGREVRLAPRLQVLDLCDLVDPPGGAARRREQVAHDPHSRAHRRARAEDRARRAGAHRGSSNARRPTKRSPTRRSSPLKHVHEVRSAARTVASLDKPVGDESDTAFGDLVAQEAGNVEEEVVLALGDDALHRAIKTLPEREQLVIKLRYGLDGDHDPKSLEEIGRRLGITRERVRQIEMQALGRLAEQREIAALSPAV